MKQFVFKHQASEGLFFSSSLGFLVALMVLIGSSTVAWAEDRSFCESEFQSCMAECQRNAPTHSYEIERLEMEGHQGLSASLDPQQCALLCWTGRQECYGQP